MKWDPIVKWDVKPGTVADPGRASCPLRFIDFALREADQMTIRARELRQMRSKAKPRGFESLARHLDEQAEKARAWALAQGAS